VLGQGAGLLQGLAQHRQGGAQLRHGLLQRQLLQLLGQLGQVVQHGAHGRRHRGNDKPVAAEAQPGRPGFRMEAQIHEQVAREQGARAQLCPQAHVHQLGQHHGTGVAGGAQQGEAFRFQGDQHRNPPRQGPGLELQVEVLHLADPDAAELHRGAAGQAPHRFVEIQHALQVFPVDPLVGLVAVGEQGEGLPRGRRLGRVRVDRVLEGDAAQEHLHQGGGAHPQAVGVQAQVHPAGVPEPGGGLDQAAVGIPHQDPDPHRLPVRSQIEAGHFAHRDLPEGYGRADVQGAQLGGLQIDQLARQVLGEQRRRLQSLEDPGGAAGGARVHADEGARKQGAQTGDAIGAHPGPHHPEPAVLGQQAGGVAVQLDRDQHLAEVRAQADGGDLAHLHLLVPHPGLAGLQAFGGQEADGDGGAPLGVRREGDPGADERRHQGDQPDQGGPPAAHQGTGQIRRQVRRQAGRVWGFRRKFRHAPAPGCPRPAWDRNCARPAGWPPP